MLSPLSQAFSVFPHGQQQREGEEPSSTRYKKVNCLKEGVNVSIMCKLPYFSPLNAITVTLLVVKYGCFSFGTVCMFGQGVYVCGFAPLSQLILSPFLSTTAVVIIIAFEFMMSYDQEFFPLVVKVNTAAFKGKNRMNIMIIVALFKAEANEDLEMYSLSLVEGKSVYIRRSHCNEFPMESHFLCIPHICMRQLFRVKFLWVPLIPDSMCV